MGKIHAGNLRLGWGRKYQGDGGGGGPPKRIRRYLPPILYLFESHMNVQGLCTNLKTKTDFPWILWQPNRRQKVSWCAGVLYSKLPKVQSWVLPLPDTAGQSQNSDRKRWASHPWDLGGRSTSDHSSLHTSILLSLHRKSLRRCLHPETASDAHASHAVSMRRDMLALEIKLRSLFKGC